MSATIMQADRPGEPAITPEGYTFAIWGLIEVVSLGLAVWQVWFRRRADAGGVRVVEPSWPAPRQPRCSSLRRTGGLVPYAPAVVWALVGAALGAAGAGQPVLAATAGAGLLVAVAATAVLNVRRAREDHSS